MERVSSPGREPMPAGSLPTCPAHLSPTAKAEWKRLARSLNGVGLLTQADRAALAAYCQAYGRWVEAERQLAETPTLLRTPSGYVQQSPWLTVANKQLELMARFMAELGLTPSSRSRLGVVAASDGADGGITAAADQFTAMLERIAERGQRIGGQPRLGAPSDPVEGT